MNILLMVWLMLFSSWSYAGGFCEQALKEEAAYKDMMDIYAKYGQYDDVESITKWRKPSMNGGLKPAYPPCSASILS